MKLIALILAAPLLASCITINDENSGARALSASVVLQPPVNYFIQLPKPTRSNTRALAPVREGFLALPAAGQPTITPTPVLIWIP